MIGEFKVEIHFSSFFDYLIDVKWLLYRNQRKEELLCSKVCNNHSLLRYSQWTMSYFI